MSSTPVSMPSDLDDQQQTALDTLRNASEGQEVLFGDRKEPLTVSDNGGGPDMMDDHYLVLRGPEGGVYVIREDYSPNGTLNLTTESGENANNLRMADGGAPGVDWTRMLPGPGTSGGEAQGSSPEDGPSDDDPTVSADDGDFSGWDVSVGEGELIASGTHNFYEADLTAVFYWDDSNDGWLLDQDESTLGNLDQSSRADLLGDVESRLDAAGYEVVSTAAGEDTSQPTSRNDGGSDGGTGAQNTTVSKFDGFGGTVPPEADAEDADEYVHELSGEPDMDYQRFLADSGVPEEEVQPIDGEDDPSWTAADELLSMGEDVPKTVNNWHLVDYGPITDDTVDSLRKLAWYNVDTSELVGLAGIRRQGGTEWMVWHADDANDPSSGEREPEFRTDNPGEALEEVESYLYGDDEEVDISVEHDPATGEATIRDALSNTHVVQALARARSADPFNVRSYVRETSVPGFIRDLDNELVRFYRFIMRLNEEAYSRYQDFVEGARLPTRERVKNFVLGLDFVQLGMDVRATIVSAASTLRHDLEQNVRLYPIIEHEQLGITVEYKYKSGGSRRRLSLDPRAYTVPDDSPFEAQPAPGHYITDSILPLGLSYYHFLQFADWASLDEWWFEFDPDSASGGYITFCSPNSSGNTPYRDRSSSSSSSSGGSRTASTYSGAVPTTSSGQDAAEVLANPESLSPDNITKFAERLDDAGEYSAMQYLFVIAVVADTIAEMDDRDQDADEMDLEPFKSKILGNIHSPYQDVYENHGLARKNVWDPPLMKQAVENYQTGGASTIEDALDRAVEDMGDDMLTSDEVREVAIFTPGGRDGSDDSDGGEEGGDTSAGDGNTPPLPSEMAPIDGGDPEGVDDDADDPGPTIEGPDDEPELSEQEEYERRQTAEEAERIANALDEGDITEDQLTDDQRQTLSEAQEMSGVLPEGAAETLEEIRDYDEDDGLPDDPEADPMESDFVEENMEATREMAEQEREEYRDAMYDNWDVEESYEDRGY